MLERHTQANETPVGVTILLGLAALLVAVFVGDRLRATALWPVLGPLVGPSVEWVTAVAFLWITERRPHPDVWTRGHVRQLAILLLVLTTVGVLLPLALPTRSAFAHPTPGLTGFRAGWSFLFTPAGVAHSIPALAGVVAGVGLVMAAAHSDTRGRRLVSVTSLALVLLLLTVVSCFDTVCRYSSRSACYGEQADVEGY